MFSTDNSRCPVNIFKPYLSKRPRQLRPNATDAVNKNPVHFQQSHSKPWVILPNDERVKNRTFNFLDQKGLLLNLRIITLIIALLIFTMARILFNTKIIIENVKNV